MANTVKYPVGIQDFEKIRRGGYAYVDKTACIRQLIEAGEYYYFLSRPRRFGKSLLLSTIAAYFEGKQELFEGLAIAETAGNWPQHPVLYLDLGGKPYDDPKDLTERLHLHLVEWERLYGRDSAEAAVEDRFYGIIRRACERKQQQTVILIDEYDKPLLESAGNEELQNHYRARLRAFYFNLKSRDKYIKFAMLTGVTKFSKLSIFSDLNNLEDISMDEEFATICGITSKELDTYFAPGLASMAEKHNLSLDRLKLRLERQYDGYMFAKRSEHVYNPFSLLKTLRKGEFNDYWFATGTPSFLVDMLNREQFSLANLPNEPVPATVLDALDTLERNPLPILYQSGYLTIDHCDDGGNYYLRFPNEEVERGFLRELLPRQLAKGVAPTSSLIIRMVNHIRQGRAEDFMLELQALLADIPYERGKPGEIYFRNLSFTIFRLVGFSCEVEHPVSAGRTDVVIKTDHFIYVLELKVDESVEAALRQIEERGYDKPYATDKRKLFKIGVNFSSQTKQVDKWLIVEGEDASPYSA